MPSSKPVFLGSPRLSSYQSVLPLLCARCSCHRREDCSYGRVSVLFLRIHQTLFLVLAYFPSFLLPSLVLLGHIIPGLSLSLSAAKVGSSKTSRDQSRAESNTSGKKSCEAQGESVASSSTNNMDTINRAL